ncbi:WD40-repeat-containing domain protein [Boletus reticuloceps]|uniref:WD40-repeat-containing domain protein n=1 Tax=Boletus reticuloceps TaxID=495285 RepID=A0A8I2YRR2_9AGAM|nr:WD40-repeat-containing domain protein [Boletus reticuloceps]KAG6377275.1 WD40-repeat-containing domain protein [Boletus reticuloceps]
MCGGEELGTFRPWRVKDGQEVGKPIRAEKAEIYAAALSPDCKWLVCGLKLLGSVDGRSQVIVWDAQTHKKVFDVKDGHTNTVFSVDIGPDSTKFATGGSDNLAFIWSMTTGERLIGPLQHDGWAVVAVQFSPNGDRIATASAENKDAKPIRIYDTENGQQLVEIPFRCYNVSSPLAWSADGRELLAASYSEVRRFDSSSGTLLSKWSVPGGGSFASVVLAHNQRFLVVVAKKTLSFWDASSYMEIGTAIEHANDVRSVALSPDDDYIASGEENGKLTLRRLWDILPSSYLTVNLPLMHISGAVFKSWTQGDWTRVEEVLAQDIMRPSDSLSHARALALRALVRTRLKNWDMALDDAKTSLGIQGSVIGYVSHAISLVGSGEYEAAMDEFDSVFCDGLPCENNLLLLVKAILAFECKKHDEAISRVDDLIDIMDKSPYIAVRAHIFFLLGTMAGDNARKIDMFKRVEEAIPVQQSPDLEVISLIFGWDFDKLASATQDPDLAQKYLATLASKDPSRY